MRIFLFLFILAIVGAGLIRLTPQIQKFIQSSESTKSNIQTSNTSTETSCEMPQGETASFHRNSALLAEHKRNSDCAIRHWQKVVEKRPTDVTDLGNLAMRLTQSERYEEALPYYENAIQLGGGYYDLFAFYARSLRELKKWPEATSWYYRTLSVQPQLADITEELSELLVMDKQYYEALNLLSGYGENVGHPDYFKARIISIQTILENMTDNVQGERKNFRIPKIGNHHFYVFVKLAEGKSDGGKAFMIDTGATLVTLNEALLEETRAKYQKTAKRLKMKTADGRVVQGTRIKIAVFQFGPHQLENIDAVVCEGCSALIGQNVLGKFDLKTEKINGIEFMYLTER